MQAKKQAVGAWEQVADVKGRFPLRLNLFALKVTVKRLAQASRRRHVMSGGALASRCEAFNLSSENQLPTNAW